MKKLTYVPLILFSAFCFAASSNIENDFNSMVQAERDFAKLSVEKGMREAFITYLGQDSVVFDPGATSGMAWAKNLPQERDGVLNWSPAYADISSSGEMGYTTGPWTFTKEAKPNEVVYGDFNSVWKKQADGTWKNICDFGVNHPAPPASGAAPEPSFKEVPSQKVEKIDVLSVRESLLNADRQFSQLSVEKGTSAAYLSTLTSDARLYRKGSLPFLGIAAIKTYFSNNSVQQQWEPAQAEVSIAGDLGFTYGSIDTQGKTVKYHYMRIWKKQKDGSWKVVLDVNNVL